jgi:hypothetical protein
VTPPPASGSTHHNVSTAEGTVTSVADLTATVIPISAVFGMFILGGAVAWFFRRKLCRYRNKSNKDDMASVQTFLYAGVLYAVGVFTGIVYKGTKSTTTV